MWDVAALVLHIIQLNGMILPLGGECHNISPDWEILIPNSSILYPIELKQHTIVLSGCLMPSIF